MHWHLRIISITSNPERRPAQPLDRAVIGLDTVVEIFRLPVLDAPDIRLIPLQLPQRFAISRVLVGVDEVRWPVLAGNS
jgi:hypothetical protein